MKGIPLTEKEQKEYQEAMQAFDDKPEKPVEQEKGKNEQLQSANRF